MKFKALLIALTITSVTLLGGTLAPAATLSGVRSITFTNSRADWYYIEELEVLNTGGVDVASASFGTTATASGAPAFGSTLNGGIDDIVGAGCCANGWHADTNLVPPAQFYTINLPSEQEITEITFWNRQDGCCQERMDGITITYHSDLNGTGTLLATQQVDGLGVTGPGGSSVSVIPEPSAAILGAFGILALVGRRRRRS